MVEELKSDRMTEGAANQTPASKWLPGTSISILQPPAVRELKEAGFAWVELTWHAKKNELPNRPELKLQFEAYIEELRRSGLDIWTLHIPYGQDWDISQEDELARQGAVERVSGVLRLAREWGVERTVLHPSAEPIAPNRRAGRMEACKESLRAIAAVSEETGVKVGVECLPRTCLGNSAEEMVQLVDTHPALGVCVDVNHLVKDLPEDFIKKLGQRIVTIHLSDNDGLDEKHWLPGKGVLHWKEIMRALDESGYEGAFMYEVRPLLLDELSRNYKQLMADYREPG
ncbi:endonuclease [Paenibacillus sp. J31TS4]|uniref:sugar phosphate isomerase/epimerase family protein n=1 Tax=Paenibacillus sp. J31TS4 TaxID=2807195 RepID=UPI001B163F11|nr:sugar phosphate isomerase/epimerase family protein [Paenibacillus sp. J31TS4]GIP38002.1 endonuclease [Paenibacillus sp. J31TS4]